MQSVLLAKDLLQVCPLAPFLQPRSQGSAFFVLAANAVFFIGLHFEKRFEWFHDFYVSLMIKWQFLLNVDVFRDILTHLELYKTYRTL